MSLRFAIDCLLNARALLSAPPPPPPASFSAADIEAELASGGVSCVRPPPRTPPGDALVCCLLDIAYLSLVAEDPATALDAASAALSTGGAVPDFVHLAHVYAAEALVMLNRYEEVSYSSCCPPVLFNFSPGAGAPASPSSG